MLKKQGFYFKNIKSLFWVPIVLLFILIPVVIGTLYNTMAEQEAAALQQMLRIFQQVTPLFSTWWLVFILREYIDGDGAEILYTYEGVYRSKLGLVLFTLACYLALLAFDYAFLSVLYAKWTSIIWVDYVKMGVVCLFFTGLTYLVMYLLRSTIAGMVCSILYYFAISLSGQMSNPFISVYFDYGGGQTGFVSPMDLKTRYIPVLFLAAALFVLAYIRERQYRIH